MHFVRQRRLRVLIIRCTVIRTTDVIGTVDFRPVRRGALGGEIIGGQKQGRRGGHGIAAIVDRPAFGVLGLGQAAGRKCRPGQAVPTGSIVSIDGSTWSPNGVGGGTILVTITAPNSSPASYLTLVSAYDGVWKVDATMPGNAATAVTTS